VAAAGRSRRASRRHPARGLDQVVRASVHYDSDEAEVDRFVAAVRDITAA
jgi:selenocysteine lyase/cysteine desulfurase